jgi:hypothetical protein
MSVPDKKPSAKIRVQAHRERLRAQGLRPVQIWVPDVRSKEFQRQAHLQSLAVKKFTFANEDQEFIDSLVDDV